MIAKRILDVIVSCLALLLLLPLLLLLVIAVLASLGYPILYKQRRPGLAERPFHIYKFRTMLNLQDGEGELLQDEQRLTTFGKFLRRTSLDELPELWNVLRGEMSLVGPRPLLMQYLQRYNTEQRRRHEMKPGITGWAQIHGRNAVSWEDRFKLDVWYVDHWNFWLDLKILFLTIFKALKGEGISAAGHVTMPEFAGVDSSLNRVEKTDGDGVNED